MRRVAVALLALLSVAAQAARAQDAPEAGASPAGDMQIPGPAPQPVTPERMDLYEMEEAGWRLEGIRSAPARKWLARLEGARRKLEQIREAAQEAGCDLKRIEALEAEAFDLIEGLSDTPEHKAYRKAFVDLPVDEISGLEKYYRALNALYRMIADELDARYRSCRRMGLLARGKDVEWAEPNYCRDKQLAVPNDPYFRSKGSWDQDYDDQWAIKRVGFTEDEQGSAWALLPDEDELKPVVVAVVDSGLDWNHADIAWESIWRNEDEIPGNGKDDDGNGYVDDIIGWNFIDDDNVPFDYDGHGTFVTGIIAAATNNGRGIAGLNPAARIMVLKALNAFGHSRASFVAEAIFYAANNGARVINVSVGGRGLTRVEQEAVRYATSKGAIVVVASGNEGIETKDYGPAGIPEAFTVATTDIDDRRAPFSNWGQAVDIAAPGVDVLSLRARRTDLMLGIPGIDYEAGSAFVGEDRRYYRASGSSFAAPIVSAVASLLLAVHPEYTPTQVARLLTQNARDIEVPGWDQLTGYGLLDARAALRGDPDRWIEARVEGVGAVRQDGKVYIEVRGTADAGRFAGGRIELAAPGSEDWKTVAQVERPVRRGRLALVPATHIDRPGEWRLRVVVRDAAGDERESRASLNIQ